MKKAFLALFVLSLFSLKAQMSDYFTGNPYWRHTNNQLSSCCMYVNEYIFYVNGDSLLNSKTYKKIFKRNQYSAYWAYQVCQPVPPPPWNNCGTPVYTDTLYCLLRQDSLKIWMYDTTNLTDSLVYDFNLQIGDSVNKGVMTSSPFVVQGIDSIPAANNSYRKKFLLDSANGVFLLEGIGHNEGFMCPYVGANVSGYFQSLDCFVMNDTTWYSYNGMSCDLTLNLRKQENIALGVYPNPANDVIIARLNFPAGVSCVTAIDISGKEYFLSVNKEREQGEIVIDAKPLSPGIYFLKILLPGTILTKKIIVQRN